MTFDSHFSCPFDELREHIEACERGQHVQQVAYSTHADALTQTCFTCQRIRTTMELPA